MAREMFEEVHYNMIETLLYNCPLDKMDEKTGMKFWTSPKRPPTAINYDPND